MSKADVLLKRASAFEKLALYSDRKTFLQAIAQSQDALQPILTTVQQFVNNSFVNRWDKVKSYTDLTVPAQQLQSIVEQFSSGGPGGKQAREGLPRVVPLMDRVIDAAQKNDLMPEAMNSLHQMRDSVAQGLQQASAPAQTQPEVASDTSPQETDETVTFPQQGQKMDVIKGYQPIDRATQQAVFDFVTSENLGVPTGKVDGSLGRVTRKAIEAVKDYFARTYPNNPRMTDQQVYTAVKFKKR